MFDDMKETIDTTDDDQVKDYLSRLLDKKAFDHAGLIYGMGHAIYSISDPRSEVLKECAKALAIAKGKEEEYNLYERVAKMAPELIAEKRKMYKGVSPNVDFYSGLIYRMLDLFTLRNKDPLFRPACRCPSVPHSRNTRTDILFRIGNAYDGASTLQG